MSDGPKTSEQLRSTSTRSNPRNQPHEPYDSFFRGDFRRLFQYLESLCNGEPTQQSERNAFTDAIRWLAISLAKNTAFQALVMALVIAAIGSALYAWNIAVDEKGRIDPNWASALLTLAIVFYSILQWSVIKKQTNEFVTQNEIMREQNTAILDQVELARRQLKQTEAASAQTDEMIDHMRDERRAYLSTSISTHGAMNTAYGDYIEPDVPLVIRNSGKTPAVIAHAYVDILTYEPSLEAIEASARRQPVRRTVVGPDATVVFNVNQNEPPPRISRNNCDEIGEGRMDAYLVGAFIYSDPFGTERKTLCCYKSLRGNFVFVPPFDGDMT